MFKNLRAEWKASSVKDKYSMVVFGLASVVVVVSTAIKLNGKKG